MGDLPALAKNAGKPKTMTELQEVFTSLDTTAETLRAEYESAISAPGADVEAIQRALSERFEGAYRATLATRVLDDDRDTPAFGSSTQGDRDRYDYDRLTVLKECIKAWRENPLARRQIELNTEYVIGGGLKATSAHKKTNEFLEKFWEHELNDMVIRTMEWSDELERAGELFITVATDAAGMSYVRSIPATDIGKIKTAPNDPEQPLRFYERDDFDETGRTWKAYRSTADRRDANGKFETVMIHCAINRPSGAVHGESAIAPNLKWLTRYAGWLEDRARLNKFRQAFMYIVRGNYADETARKTREVEINRNPPTPGSVLVQGTNEAWGILHPNLDSFEASEDGLALKKMISVGAGVPMYFFAEPESSTKSTAESAGGPTFRRFQQRQIAFIHFVRKVLKCVLRRRAVVAKDVDTKAKIEIAATDISGRDNAALATAANIVQNALIQLYDRGLVDDSELVRLVYTFLGELPNVEEILDKARAYHADRALTAAAASPLVGTPLPNGKPKSQPIDLPKVDGETGDLKGAM